jgi:hypothetical protein
MAIDINIPSQVKNYANLAAFPVTGTLKTIFIAEDTNKTYRWTGSAYVEISASQATAWGTITGTLSAQTDLDTALSGKVPTSRTLTINGTTQDLSADRTFTISTGITIGTTAITSGTVGRVLFEGTGNVVQESANLFWDNTNGRLGIGTSTPTVTLEINGGSIIQTLTLGLGRNAIASNTALGYQTLNAVTSGSVNTAVGYQALLALTSGYSNTALGVTSLAALTFGVENTSVGVRALQAATNGSTNVAIGFQTLQTNISGNGNCGIGHNTLNLTKANNNIGLGYQAGQSNTTGANNIFIGASSTGVSASESNRTWIGNATTATTWLAGNVLINTTTDAGYKLDVNGTARVRGAGTTGATFALTVQNSASTNIMRLQDDGYLNVTSGVFTSALRGVNVEFTNLLYGANFWCTVDGSIKIGSGQSASVASAIFQADSTTRGFLPPRMTTTQKNAIATPATGLMVYDTTLNLMALYNGTTWTTL